MGVSAATLALVRTLVPATMGVVSALLAMVGVVLALFAFPAVVATLVLALLAVIDAVVGRLGWFRRRETRHVLVNVRTVAVTDSGGRRSFDPDHHEERTHVVVRRREIKLACDRME